MGASLYFLLVRRVPPVDSPVLVEVFDILRRRGFGVETGIAEEMVVRADLLDVTHDLYVVKSHTELTLSLAGTLHGQGARLLNPYAACLAAQDKITACRRLRAAGLPAPRSWVTGDLTLLTPHLADGPLIIKPHRGHRGAGIHVVRDAVELAAVPPSPVPVIVQDFVRGPGEDLKVYVIGAHVFGTRKRFSPTSFTRAGVACAVSEEVRRIALRCGEVFGLGLYGLDLIESPDGPVVVDVNYFPGYKGVPGAAPLIADYIADYADGRHALPGDPPALPASAATAAG